MSLQASGPPSAGYGRRLAARFGFEDAPSFVIRTLGKGKIAVTHIRCDLENNGLTRPFPREDALLLTLQLRACAAHELWIGGKPVATGRLEAGMVNIYDLRSDPQVNSLSPFENLHFYLPRKVLDAISLAEHGRRIPDAAPSPGSGISDGVIHGLGRSLLPALARPEEANLLFVDHVTSAVASYMSAMLLKGPTAGAGRNDGLAPWQRRAVAEMIMENLQDDLPVDRLAEACGLPVNVFRRGFRRAFGVLPHRWLLRQRIEKAQRLIALGRLSLAEVAATCGFADRRHLERVLRRRCGR